jgi:hypothetical protein
MTEKITKYPARCECLYSRISTGVRNPGTLFSVKMIHFPLSDQVRHQNVTNPGKMALNSQKMGYHNKKETQSRCAPLIGHI